MRLGWRSLPEWKYVVTEDKERHMDRDPCLFNVIVNSAERLMEIFIGAKRQDLNGVKNER